MAVKSNTQDFIKKSNKKHNNKYDYSLVDYKKSNIKVKINCKEHGIFEQRPNDHLNGQGCPYCGGTKKLTVEMVKNKAIKKHNNKYDYSLFIKYKNQKDVIKIICPIHGIFEQKINNHLNGKGCKYCSNNIKKTNIQFIEESNIIHNNLYDYSLCNYIDAKTNVIIICKNHGEFYVSPNNHISKKSGCPICNESKGELYISNILKKHNINYIREYKLYHKKYAPIYPLKADFYLPKHNMIIEYNGIQHYKKFNFFGGGEGFKKIKERDKIKKKICNSLNINLITIKYSENIEKKLNNVVFLLKLSYLCKTIIDN